MMHKAIYLQNLEMMDTLVSSGCCVNARDASGTTPLMATVTNADFSGTAYLLNKGADVNAISNRRTAIYGVILDSEQFTLRLLINGGALPNICGAGEHLVMRQIWMNNITNAIHLILAGAEVDLQRLRQFGNDEMTAAREQMIRYKFSLQHLARASIRRHLTFSGSNLYCTVHRLELPQKILNFILNPLEQESGVDAM